LRSRTPRLRAQMAVAAGLVLAACGGSGGSDGGATGSAVVSGVAATGAPMEGAVVRVIDASGRAVALSAVVGSDGRYEVRIPAGARAPKLFHADLDDGEDHFAVADEAAILGGTVNITPLTSLIAARLSPTGMPQDLVLQFLGQSVVATPLPTPARISAQTQAVLQLIAPLRQALDDSLDPLTGRFAVGGVGHDKLLDSLAVTFTPRSDTVANIEVALRTRRAADAPLPAVVFASNAPMGSLQVGNGLARPDFAPGGTSARIAALVAEINACLALPVAARVSDPAQLTAAGVLGVCRDMYFDADPVRFLHNGVRFERGAGGELLNPRRQRLDQPVYRYTRIGTGLAPYLVDLVAFTVRWSDLDAGVSDLVTIYARQDGADRLKLYGNQYAYGMQVNPIVRRQTHLRVDSGHMDNLRSGYILLVPNLRTNDGQPYFDRVEVVTPAGLDGNLPRVQLTLRPRFYDPRQLRMDGKFGRSSTATNVWLSGGWVNVDAARDTRTASGQTAPHPIDLDTGGEVWIDLPDRGWGDDRIETLGQQSVWTLRYFHRNSTTPVVQHLLTVGRAPSLRELRQIPFATLTPATVDWLRDKSMDPAANPPLFWIGAAGSQPRTIDLAWTVPWGATAPARVSSYGFDHTTVNLTPTSWLLGVVFEKSAPVTSAQRHTTLRCAATLIQALGAVLCDGGSDRYSVNTRFTQFGLSGRSLRLVEYSHYYSSYIPQTRPTATSPLPQPLNARP
jgi:hypothetical protein